MHCLLRITAVLALVVLTQMPCAATGEVDTPSTITVQTTDGRELIGMVDEKTDDEHLWIRQETSDTIFAVAVKWSDLTAATVDGDTVELAALPELVPRLQSSGPEGFLTEFVLQQPADVLRVVHPGSAVRSTGYRQIVRPLPHVRITHLEVDAALVQLDRDVEPDGLELAIAAVDSHGIAVPIRGSLTAKLWGNRVDLHPGQNRFVELQRWSRPVALHHFQDNVAFFVLPFRSVDPEFELDLRPDALLNVQLGVFGQGNYEATADVEIRQYSFFRDRLQNAQGTRLFQNEFSENVRRVRHPNFRPSRFSR